MTISPPTLRLPYFPLAKAGGCPMDSAVQKRYKKMVMGLYRRLRHPRQLKKSAAMRWFARHFLDKSVWKPSRQSFAGGLAIGMFVTMLLTPGQMGIAILLAGFFRMNIPIAVAACWLSNPFTFVPVVWSEIKLGNGITRLLGLGDPPPLEWMQLKTMVHEAPGVAALWHALQPWAVSVYVGGVAAGLSLAVLSYGLAYFLWDWLPKVVHHRPTAKTL